MLYEYNLNVNLSAFHMNQYSSYYIYITKYRTHMEPFFQYHAASNLLESQF